MYNHQLKITPGGLWHRRLHDNGHTACGLEIGGAYQSRDFELDDKLCSSCFTTHERQTGEVIKLETDGEPPPDGYRDDEIEYPTHEFERPSTPVPDGDDE